MLTKLRSISREVVPVQLCGNVSIDPSAVIAPGVLLQAEGSSQIKIGAGVCIGAGTIVHAAGGNLYIEAGACLGRGVLIVGSGSIDRDACIGAGTTAIDPCIEAGAVIPTHSLLGDRSRGEVSVVDTEEIPPNLHDPTPPTTDPVDVWDDLPEKPTTANEPSSSPARDDPQTTPSPSATTGTSPPPETSIAPKSTNYVAGRDRFDRMKRSLFNHSGNND